MGYDDRAGAWYHNATPMHMVLVYKNIYVYSSYTQ
jgi:hypothetical protein